VSGPDPARRARRLLRWYPPLWRARYGEEFAELLIADLAERPRSWRRTADVARAGLLARLAGAGLATHPLEVLHAFGVDHTRALTGMSLAQALALRVAGSPLPPMAIGRRRWHLHGRLRRAAAGREASRPDPRGGRHRARHLEQLRRPGRWSSCHRAATATRSSSPRSHRR
jgi:hypothetical protein